MKDINACTFSGRLVRDIEVRSTKGGTPVGTFSIAYNGRKKNQQTGRYEDVPNFLDCVIYGARAQAIAQYLTKGTEVFVEGELQHSTWTDKKTGHNRSKHELSVNDIKFYTEDSQPQTHDEYQDYGW